MAAHVPQRVNLTVIIANDDQRIVTNGEREIIARTRDFTRMPHEQPSAAPDAIKLNAIEQRVCIEIAGQAEAFLARRYA